MRRLSAMGIVSGLADLDADAGEIGGIDLDPADLLPGKILAYGDRHEGSPAPDLAQDAAEVVLLGGHQSAETAPHRRNVPGLLGDRAAPDAHRRRTCGQRK